MTSEFQFVKREARRNQSRGGHVCNRCGQARLRPGHEAADGKEFVGVGLSHQLHPLLRGDLINFPRLYLRGSHMESVGRNVDTDLLLPAKVWRTAVD